MFTAPVYRVRNVIPLLVGNSGSPSIVEQLKQVAGCSCIPLLILASSPVEYPMPYASCLASCSLDCNPVCSSQLCLSFFLLQLGFSFSLEELCLSKVLGLYSLFYLGHICIAL